MAGRYRAAGWMPRQLRRGSGLAAAAG